MQLPDGPVQTTIRGKLLKADPPAVGDFVEVEPQGGGGGYALTKVLPRRSVLERRAAGHAQRKQVMIANIDRVIVVFAAATPDPMPVMLDHFLVVAEANRLEAHIVINKIELLPPGALDPLLQPYREAGYPVHLTSVKAREGLEAMRGVLSEGASVLVGPSGVGKSSLLNALYPGLDLKVGQVSEAYGTGRHTTVGGFLIGLPGGGSVADTAGLREVGLWMVPPEELPDCFPEFRPHLDGCRFNNCRHLEEPDCAIQAALERGEIAEPRYRSYTQLRLEAEETFPKW